MNTPRSESDLTAKARIRNAALELFAECGAGATPLRRVAELSGVTVGLITHHFGSKAGLRTAVDEYVVDKYREALSVPHDSDPREIAKLRDDSVHRMLSENPNVRGYLRRAYIEPPDQEYGALERLTDLTRDEVEEMRRLGYASSDRAVAQQATLVIVRQLGELLIQPLADRVWRRLSDTSGPAPRITTALEESPEASAT